MGKQAKAMHLLLNMSSMTTIPHQSVRNNIRTGYSVPFSVNHCSFDLQHSSKNPHLSRIFMFILF